MSSENYIVDRIERLCEEKGISRYRLAQKAGISQSSISTLLNRKSLPSITTLEKICNGLDITLAQFFTTDEDMPDLTKEQKELLAMWQEMSEQEKAMAKAYMQGLIRK